MSIPRLAGAQDLLASARTQYQAAADDEALTTLQQLAANKSALSATDAREVEEYRFLCLLALGRKDEARAAMGVVVKSDPLYTLEAGATPPRVLNAFTEVRRELLPQIATQLYAESKASYDKKETADARAGFETLMTMLADPDMQGKLADLGTLAKGFLDLVGHRRAGPGCRAGRGAGRTGRQGRRGRAAGRHHPEGAADSVEPAADDAAQGRRPRADDRRDRQGRGGEVLSPIHPVYDGMVHQRREGLEVPAGDGRRQGDQEPQDDSHRRPGAAVVRLAGLSSPDGRPTVRRIRWADSVHVRVPLVAGQLHREHRQRQQDQRDREQVGEDGRAELVSTPRRRSTPRRAVRPRRWAGTARARTAASPASRRPG